MPAHRPRRCDYGWLTWVGRYYGENHARALPDDLVTTTAAVSVHLETGCCD